MSMSRSLWNQSKPRMPVKRRRQQPPIQDQKRRHIKTERSLGGRSDSLRCFAKVWYEGFFTHQDLIGKDEVPAVEILKELDGVGNKLSLFLCNDEGSGGPCEADAIQRFCKDASLNEVECGIGQAGGRRACWVDERNSADLTGEGNARFCKNMLTATGLLRHLRQPVRTIPALPTLLSRMMPTLSYPITNARPAI
jgi:hypothetical protein